VKDGPPVNRFTLSLLLSDCTACVWVTFAPVGSPPPSLLLLCCYLSDGLARRCFDDQGKQLLGHSADELDQFLRENPDRLEEFFVPIMLMPQQLKLRVKRMPALNSAADGGGERTNISIFSTGSVNFRDASTELLTQIKKYGIQL
jgi:hypothetical protein